MFTLTTQFVLVGRLATVSAYIRGEARGEWH